MDRKAFKTYVNQDKSGTGRPWERQFLSFQITEDGEIAIAPKAIQGYKANVRSLWNARQSLTSKQLVEQWREYSINFGGITSNWQASVGISNNLPVGHVATCVNVSGSAGITRKGGLTLCADWGQNLIT